MKSRQSPDFNNKNSKKLTTTQNSRKKSRTKENFFSADFINLTCYISISRYLSSTVALSFPR